MRRTLLYKTLPFNRDLKDYAKKLRKAGYLHEVIFWKHVKGKQFLGLDFDRQKIIGNYIVDFFSPDCGVVIEIDGLSHTVKEEKDKIRDAFLHSLGLYVIRISACDVLNNIEGVMQWLKEQKVFEAFL